MRRVLMFTAILWAASTIVAFHQDSTIVIGSPTAGTKFSQEPGRWQELIVHPPLELVEVDIAETGLAPARTLKPHTVGPFNEARFGFRFVDVYFDRITPPEKERSTLSANSTVRLTVATRQLRGVTRIWQLETQPDDRAAGDALLPDPLSINDEPDEQELAGFATDDRSLPILDVQYASHTFGANSGADLQRHLLIDFRARRPRVIALLQNVDYFGGGACNAHDSLFGTRNEIGCRWDRARRDFRCAETFHRYDSDWGKRRGSRFFLLDSGEPLLNPPAATVSTARTFAERASASSKPIYEATVTGLGETRRIDVRKFGPASVVLIGTPLLTESLREMFGARFHVAVLRQGQETSVREIVPRTRLHDVTRNPQVALFDDVYEPSERFVPDELVPAFRSRLLIDRDTFKVLQVTVSEGAARGVYLVGLEFSAAHITADALLVATDAPTYEGCNRWVLPPTAVAMTVKTDTFSALLDVEPANLEELSRDTDDWHIQPRTEAPVCRAATEVKWQANVGFALQSRESPCTVSDPPRRVGIAEDGTLTSTTSPAKARPRR